MKKLMVAIVCFVFLAQIQAQENTVLVELEPLEITNSRLEVFSVGTKSVEYDSLTLSQFKNGNIADLLSSESSMFIKSYGRGSLATSSFRGGNASQTAVLWNGFSLNSSANGTLDFSLIPSSFFNKIIVQYGGECAQWGSGALGGAIHLNNESSFGKGSVYSLGGSFGSFGLNTQSMKTQISKEKMTFSLALFRSQSENDFPFFKEVQGKDTLVVQNHANYLAAGLLTDFQYRIKKNKKIQFSLWHQEADRNISPIVFQTESHAYQQDKSTRFMVNYLWFKSKNKLRIKGGYFDNQNDYQDSTALIFSENHAQMILTEVTYDRELSRGFQYSGGALNSFAIASASNYTDQVQENRLSIYSFLKYTGKKKKLFTVLSGRAIVLNENAVTPTFSFQNTLIVNRFIKFKSKVSSVYRLPTLNDRYWNPGGNLELMAESGFSEEIGVELNIDDKGLIAFNSEVTLFNKNIDNWIAWVPNGAVWSPENIKEVWSRGVESLSNIIVLEDDMKISLKLMTSYVLSTNEKVLSAIDNSLGKQLIYTPRYSGFAKLTLSKKQYAVSYRHNYTGYTFTTSDNSEYLTPFDLGSVHVSFNAKRGKYKFEGYFGIENIWNEDYVRIAYRPMPLVNYSFGININLYQPLAKGKVNK
ncbi:MAG: vitamin B12 transporter [Glaciecola sp.]|jgi:vitamin B12 transporter